jgi:hypothetical protein
MMQLKPQKPEKKKSTNKKRKKPAVSILYVSPLKIKSNK